MVMPKTISEPPSASGPELVAPFPQLCNEKIVATGSGITVGIALTETVLFLQDLDHHDPSTRKSTILRGQLHLKISKCVKIKKISIWFRGHAQTNWADGIPTNKIPFTDKKDLFTHGILYFNHGDSALMHNAYGAHFYQHARLSSSVPGKESMTAITRALFSKTRSTTSLGQTTRETSQLSLESNQGHSGSFSENKPPFSVQKQSQCKYQVFPVGDYIYNFEFLIDGSMPETIKADVGFVRYDLDAVVERPGVLLPNLLGKIEIPVIRIPADDSVEQFEPISISRSCEDQLQYDIVISGKSFPLGSEIPITLKLRSSTKVQCHQIKVYVTEYIESWMVDRSVHRYLPAKNVLLFEKRADFTSTGTCPRSFMCDAARSSIKCDHGAVAVRQEEVAKRTRTNLLRDFSSETAVAPMEIEFSVQLPNCREMEGEDSQRLHFDTTYENIQIKHWIKIVFHLSTVDKGETSKRRHSEISVESPFRILSCKAQEANINLPAYEISAPIPNVPAEEFDCGCSDTPSASRGSFVTQASGSDREDVNFHFNRRRSSGRDLYQEVTYGPGGLTRPPQAHLAQEQYGLDFPIHVLSAPLDILQALDVSTAPPLITSPWGITSIW